MGGRGEKGVVEVRYFRRHRLKVLLLHHLLEGLRYPGCVDVVWAARATCITGNALPDQEVVQGSLSVTQKDHPDQAVWGHAGIVSHGTTRSASSALVASIQILAGSGSNLLRQRTGCFCLNSEGR